MGSYIVMAMGGFVATAGIAVVLAALLNDPGEPPAGPALTYLGANFTWLWLYDCLYRRLRRPEPTSRWARLIGTLGRAGKRAGPTVFIVGVIVTFAL
jgi:hypothetical protein